MPHAKGRRGWSARAYPEYLRPPRQQGAPPQFAMRALEQSVREGRIQLLASLLEPRLVAAASAPLPGTTDKSTLLHLACELGNTACAQLLVEWAPQSQHARTRSGCTPLLLCCAHGQGRAHCEGVRLLARAGTAPLDARRKADGAGAAHLCAAAGCAQCLQLLLTKAPQLVDILHDELLARCEHHDTRTRVGLACRPNELGHE